MRYEVCSESPFKTSLRFFPRLVSRTQPIYKKVWEKKPQLDDRFIRSGEEAPCVLPTLLDELSPVTGRRSCIW